MKGKHWFYGASVALVIVCAALAWSETASVLEQADTEWALMFSQKSVAQMTRELAAVEEQVYGMAYDRLAPGTYKLYVKKSGQDHFRLLKLLREVRGSLRRYETERPKWASYDHNVDYGKAAYDSLSFRLTNLENELARVQVSPSEYAEFDRLRDDYAKTAVVPPPARPGQYRRAGELWLLTYLAGTLLSGCRFLIRLSELNASALLELAYPRFWLWVLLWPVGLFRYPKAIQLKEQLRRVLEFASLLVSSSLSVFAGGVAKAADKPDGSKRQTASRGFRLHGNVTSKSLSQYLGLDGATFYGQPVQQSVLTVQLPKGLFAGVWSSTALNSRPFGSGFGSEVDYFVGWSGRVRKFDVSTSFVYLDVFPLLKLPRGDVMNATLTVSKSLKAGRQTVTPFIHTWWAWPARGREPASGWFVHLGTRYSVSFGRLTVRSKGEVVRDSGAFGFGPAVLLGGTAEASWRIGKGVSLELPFVRVSEPVSKRPGDPRHFQTQLGLGLSYSF